MKKRGRRSREIKKVTKTSQNPEEYAYHVSTKGFVVLEPIAEYEDPKMDNLSKIVLIVASSPNVVAERATVIREREVHQS
jgi:hypothetical protein